MPDIPNIDDLVDIRKNSPAQFIKLLGAPNAKAILMGSDPLPMALGVYKEHYAVEGPAALDLFAEYATATNPRKGVLHAGIGWDQDMKEPDLIAMAHWISRYEDFSLIEHLIENYVRQLLKPEMLNHYLELFELHKIPITYNERCALQLHGFKGEASTMGPSKLKAAFEIVCKKDAYTPPFLRPMSEDDSLLRTRIYKIWLDYIDATDPKICAKITNHYLKQYVAAQEAMPYWMFSTLYNHMPPADRSLLGLALVNTYCQLGYTQKHNAKANEKFRAQTQEERITHDKWVAEHLQYTGMYYAYAMLQDEMDYSTLASTVPMSLPQIRDCIVDHLANKPPPDEVTLPDLNESLWLTR